MNGENEGFVNFKKEYDPAVAAIITQSEKRQEESRLPRDEKIKKASEKKRAKARLKNRVNWDLPVALKKRIIRLSEQEGVPTSQLAAAFLIEGLQRYEAEEIELNKIHSDSPRYDWNLILPELTK